MDKRQTLSINTITAADIKGRHPRYMTCETDKAYAQLANDIYNLLHDGFSFMEERQFRNACISLALFFEDLRSDLHLFDTFQQMYEKMYGCYLPFFNTSNADEPDAPLDAMRFMLWHSCVAEREGQVINPTNDGLKLHAGRLLNLWTKRQQTLPPNEELANYLYAEETQTDANEVKTVLVWLSRYCHLGRWFTNLSEKKWEAEYTGLFQGADKDTRDYADDCYSLFEEQTWPLSVTPQHVYAEMIRIDMDNPDDELADAIDHMEGKPLSIYEMTGSEGNSIHLRDYLGEVITVSQDEFAGNIQKILRQNTHLAGAFICLNSTWHLNGPCLWSKPKKSVIDAQLDQLRYHHHLMNNFSGQFDDFISRHGGERLYFFRNLQEYRRWLRDELGLKNGELPDNVKKDQPMVVFFEDNGQMTSCFTPSIIRHADNPTYDKSDADLHSLDFMSGRCCSPGMLLHLVKYDLLPDIMLNDMHGREHGRLLMQNNIDFLARCLRRDITDKAIARQRTFRTKEVDEGDDTKLSFETFVRMITDEKTIVSRANKKWRVVRANMTTTVINDVSQRVQHLIPTRAIYEAYLTLQADEFQVAALIPFVGRKLAPAATVLLYNMAGRGKWRNELRKIYLRHGRNW